MEILIVILLIIFTIILGNYNRNKETDARLKICSCGCAEIFGDSITRTRLVPSIDNYSSADEELTFKTRYICLQCFSSTEFSDGAQTAIKLWNIQHHKNSKGYINHAVLTYSVNCTTKYVNSVRAKAINFKKGEE